jgi:hypothetical protein
MRLLRSRSGRVYGAEIGPLRIDWRDLWTGRYGWPEFSRRDRQS